MTGLRTLVAVVLATIAGNARADFFAIELETIFPGGKPTGVNAARQFVGGRDFPGDGPRAYRWEVSTGFLNLGRLGGNFSSATAINSLGWVAGDSQTGAPGVQHAFLWRPTTGLTDLGTLGGSSSSAAAVNQVGWVVGNSQTAGNAGLHGFVWRPSTGTMTDLGTLGGPTSFAVGINASNTVTGTSDVAGGGTRPFIWTQANGLVDLGGLAGPTAPGRAFGINDSGTVVGRSRRADGTDAPVLWRSGVGFTDLGGFGGDTSTVLAINNLGTVVGESQLASQDKRAFIWDATNGFRDLNDLLTTPIPGFTLTTAYAITDAGDILALSERPDGTTVFLVTENPNFLTPVPAPAGLVLGLFALPLLRRFRRTV